MEDFRYISSRKNDGEPSAYSAEQRAIAEAMVAFHEAGHWNYNSITLIVLACNDPSHYPDLCYHWEVVIEPHIERSTL